MCFDHYIVRVYTTSIGIAYIDTINSRSFFYFKSKGLDRKRITRSMASAMLSKAPSPPVGWKASPGSPGVASVSVHGLWPGTEHQSPPLQGSSDLGKGHPAHAPRHVHVQVAGTGSARTSSHWAFHGDGSGLCVTARRPSQAGSVNARMKRG